MAQTHFQFHRHEGIDLLSARGRRLLGSDRSSDLHKLAVQLSLDPGVRSLSFVTTLPVAGEQVAVGMLVAEREEGRVAFDIVDGRLHRDIDSEGLLLIALQQHDIARIETDAAAINDEPRASNCKRIWRYRDHRVSAGLLAKIERAAEMRPLSVRDLGAFAGRGNAMPIACALICRRVLYTDLSVRFGPGSRIALRGDRDVSALNIPTSKTASRGTKL